MPRRRVLYRCAVLLVALTGGIGCGKSTVARELEARGAVVIDADRITHELQRPGTDVHRRIVERFGSGVLADDGSIDRASLAKIVFSDEHSRRDLEQIVHPAVGREMMRRILDLADTDRIVVLEVPLLVEGGGILAMIEQSGVPFAGVVVVDCSEESALERLVSGRGVDRDDARRRMAAQASRDQRLQVADFVVSNDGDMDSLRAEVDRCWRWLQESKAAPAGNRARGGAT
ncbi:MAG: dephospho-CoA kinase [Acidimicrobiales bacterium]|nr:MAG: dephospho-CoA kinase [Acidimicrobiales bacterium]